MSGQNLSVIYGSMGAGKTNFAVNRLLVESDWKKVITNVRLLPKFFEKFPQKVGLEVVTVDDTIQALSAINKDNPNCLIIVDEAQQVFTLSSVSDIKNWSVQLTQIRQWNQEVVLIAQTPELLPPIIREMCNISYKAENQDIKGFSARSLVTMHKGGNGYETCLLETIDYNLVYGTYVSSKQANTKKPKNLFFKRYLKLGLMILFILFVIFGISYKLIQWKNGNIFGRSSKSSSSVSASSPGFSDKQIKDINENIRELYVTCYRSIECTSNGVCLAIAQNGFIYSLPISQLHIYRRCPLISAPSGVLRD